MRLPARVLAAVCVALVSVQAASAADLKPRDETSSETDESAPSKRFLNTLTPAAGQEHRYLFVGAVISASIGFGLTYWAQGEVRRANSLNLAVDSRRTYQNAQATIAGANVLFAVAGAFAVYGLLAELLPRNTGADGSLTLNF